MSSKTTPRLLLRRRLAIGFLTGTVAAAVIPAPSDAGLVGHLLVGFVIIAIVFAVPLLWTILRADAAATRSLVADYSSERGPTDAVAVSASMAALGGIGLMLFTGPADTTGAQAALALGTVAMAWLLVHTTYVVRYARHYYNAEPGSVDFTSKADPPFSDFAYLAFTLGMTYQVSDTDITTPTLRKVVLFHTLLSYLFGTGIIAATINLVAGAAK